MNCKLYNVVSKRRNKLKYSYYRQHPAYFPQIYFEFLINSALPDSNSICWQNFMDKILKIINFACVKYLVYCCGAIANIKGLGFNSHQRKLSSFFYRFDFAFLSLSLFCFVFFFQIFYLLAGLSLFIFASPHHSFMRCCGKCISSIILNKKKCTPAKGVFDSSLFPLSKEFDTKIAQNVKSPWVYLTSLP